MELKAPSYLQASAPFPATGRHSLDSDSYFYSHDKGNNPFADSFPDPLCKLNVNKTPDFVKAFPRCSADGRSLLKSSSQRSGDGLGFMEEFEVRRYEATPVVFSGDSDFLPP